MTGKYSPTIKRRQFVPSETNPEYDDEGYDHYGYNKDGIDRTGMSQNDYVYEELWELEFGTPATA